MTEEIKIFGEDNPDRSDIEITCDDSDKRNAYYKLVEKMNEYLDKGYRRFYNVWNDGEIRGLSYLVAPPVKSRGMIRIYCFYVRLLKPPKSKL